MPCNKGRIVNRVLTYKAVAFEDKRTVRDAIAALKIDYREVDGFGFAIGDGSVSLRTAERGYDIVGTAAALDALGWRVKGNFVAELKREYVEQSAWRTARALRADLTREETATEIRIRLDY